MQEGLENLFVLLRDSFVFPISSAINSIGWTKQVVQFMNLVLNAIFNIFREVEPTTTIQYLTADSIAQTLGLILLFYCMKWVIGIFKYAFRVLKSTTELTPATGSSKEWRKQWKRKK